MRRRHRRCNDGGCGQEDGKSERGVNIALCQCNSSDSYAAWVRGPSLNPPLNWTHSLNISVMSSLPYAAVCSWAILSSAVAAPRCSLDRLGGRREERSDLAVLRSHCPDVVCLFSYKMRDDGMIKWNREDEVSRLNSVKYCVKIANETRRDEPRWQQMRGDKTEQSKLLLLQHWDLRKRPNLTFVFLSPGITNKTVTDNEQ